MFRGCVVGYLIPQTRLRTLLVHTAIFPEVRIITTLNRQGELLKEKTAISPFPPSLLPPRSKDLH
jgi:hypothetical protein